MFSLYNPSSQITVWPGEIFDHAQLILDTGKASVVGTFEHNSQIMSFYLSSRLYKALAEQFPNKDYSLEDFRVFLYTQGFVCTDGLPQPQKFIVVGPDDVALAQILLHEARCLRQFYEQANRNIAHFFEQNPEYKTASDEEDMSATVHVQTTPAILNSEPS